MRATEIEVEEKEVEYVYCDECGDDCTDDVEYEPREVCPSCAEGRSTWKDIKSAIDNISHDEANKNTTLGDALLAAIFLPLILVVVIGMANSEEHDTDINDILAIAAYTIGGAAWTRYYFNWDSCSSVGSGEKVVQRLIYSSKDLRISII